MIVSSMKERILLIFCFIFSNILVSQNIDFKRSNFKNNKSGLKLAKENLEKADKIRDKAISIMVSMKDPTTYYRDALFYYMKAQEFNPNNADLNFKIGSCLLFTNSKAKSYDYLKKAKDFNSKLSNEFNFYYAMSLHLDSQFDLAVEYFQKFRKNAKSKELDLYASLVKRYIQQCNNAKKRVDIDKVWVDNLELNTEFDEWGPCLSTDGDLLLFSSDRPNNNKPNETNYYDYDIYNSIRNKRKFSISKPISEINTKQNNIAGGLSYDGQRMLLYMNENNNNDVYESILKGEKWSKPKRKMGLALQGGNSGGDETFASYDPADVKVYYITDGGYSGNKDIYFSGVMDRDKDIWAGGQSAGEKINTNFQEGSVYIHPDGQSMYFSSQGHNSIGGYDIFVSYVNKLGQWETPINLGYPINTVYDDMFYSPHANGKLAYIASNRAGGKGGMDIYKVTFQGADKPMSVSIKDQLMSSIAQPIEDKSVIEPIQITEKSLTVFKGKIIDAITKNPIYSEIKITLNKTGEEFITLNSNSSTGKFLLSLPAGENYGISVLSDGYLFHSENFNIPINSGFDLVDKVIELKNIKVGSNITLRNVFFDLGKSKIKKDSYPELDRLVDLLNDISTLKIEISGHTDNIGNKDFNELLSMQRASAVLNYIVNKGINKNRLTAIGFGDSKPIDSNNTKVGRANNRRTEFKIIEN